jgi:hypothetical protein
MALKKQDNEFVLILKLVVLLLQISLTLCAIRYALCSMFYALCSMPFSLYAMLHALCSMPLAPCPFPFTLCPLPYARVLRYASLLQRIIDVVESSGVNHRAQNKDHQAQSRRQKQLVPLWHRTVKGNPSVIVNQQRDWVHFVE